VKLADHVTYIDATKMSLLHRYYLHRYLKRSPALKHFFNEVLNGLPASLDPDQHIIRIHEKQDPNGYGHL